MAYIDYVDQKRNVGAGILQWFLRLFSPEASGRVSHKRQLKAISRIVQRSRSRYFNLRTDMAMPELARFFLALYRSLYRGRRTLSHAQQSRELQHIIVESLLNKEQIEAMRSIGTERIEERFQSNQLQSEFTDVMNTLEELMQQLRTDRLFDRIDRCYNLMLDMIAFIRFDYFVVIRRFDSNFTEHDPHYAPRFVPVSVHKICAELKNFLEVCYLSGEMQDMRLVLDALKKYTGIEIVSQKSWQRTMNRLDQVLRSRILTNGVRFIDRDPGYTPRPYNAHAKIARDFFDRWHRETLDHIHRLLSERQQQEIDALYPAIFDSISGKVMQNYTHQANAIYLSNRLTGFHHIEPINYICMFLSGPYHSIIQPPLQDVLLLRGKWVNKEQRKYFSDLLYRLQQEYRELEIFDNQLSKTEHLGKDLFRSVNSIVPNNVVGRMHCESLLKEANNRAFDIVEKSETLLEKLLQMLEILIDDLSTGATQVIGNWEEVNRTNSIKIHELFSESQQRIQNFLQLNKVLMSSPVSRVQERAEGSDQMMEREVHR